MWLSLPLSWATHRWLRPVASGPVELCQEAAPKAGKGPQAQDKVQTSPRMCEQRLVL